MAGFNRGKGRTRRGSMRRHAKSLNQLVGDRL